MSQGPDPEAQLLIRLLGYCQSSAPRTGGALASSEYDGLIGGEILRRFKVVFDYAHGRLILEPNAHYAEPLECEMSDIRLRANGADSELSECNQWISGLSSEHRIIENRKESQV